MKHLRPVANIPCRAEGLCDNIVNQTQATYCFILTFMRDIVVPIVQPILLIKYQPSNDTTSLE